MPSPPADPNKHLDSLIQGQLAVTTGAIQVAIAIAATTTVVTVDTTTTPPTINPPDLDAKTFADVGMDDSLVSIFKANLKVLLSEISSDIDKLPDNANMNIGKVMDFVRLSILAAG